MSIYMEENLMDKLKMHTPNKADENFKKTGSIVSECCDRDNQ